MIIHDLILVVCGIIFGSCIGRKPIRAFRERGTLSEPPMPKPSIRYVKETEYECEPGAYRPKIYNAADLRAERSVPQSHTESHLR